MSGNGVNTLEYAHKLEKAGVPREQAEAHAMVFYELMHSELATKRDIADVKKEIADVKKEIAELRSATKRDIADVKKEITELRAAIKRDIKELDLKIENVRSELKRDIQELRSATKSDIKELENKIALKMIIHSGGTVLTILTSLVTLAKLGLLTP